MPSGTKWASQNVGARKPSDYGLYFQWGDTSGYTADQIGKDKHFNWHDSNFSKYKTTGATLELADDAANANMGGSWHMPTPTQIRELLNTAYTTNTWTTQDGVNGRLFTSKKDGSKFIFIPAAGFASSGSLLYEGSEAGVWSSMLSTDNVDSGQGLGFDSGGIYLDGSYRYCGFSVRGVLG